MGRLDAGVIACEDVVVPLPESASIGKAGPDPATTCPRRFAWRARSAGMRRITACILDGGV